MTRDREAESALPPGTPRSLSPGRAPEHDRLVSGGVAPGDPGGGEPATSGKPEASDSARSGEGDDHVGPLGGNAAQSSTKDRSDGST